MIKRLIYIGLVFGVAVAVTTVMLIYTGGDKMIAREIKADSNGSVPFGPDAKVGSEMLGQSFRAEYPRLAKIRVKTNPAILPAGARGVLRLTNDDHPGFVSPNVTSLMAWPGYTGTFRANPDGEEWSEFTLNDKKLSVGDIYIAEVSITDEDGKEIKWQALPSNGIYYGQGSVGGVVISKDFMLQPVYNISLAEMAVGYWDGRSSGYRPKPLLSGSSVIIIMAGWLAAMGLFIAETVRKT